MAEYLVIHTINSPEYGGDPIIKEMEGKNLTEISQRVASEFELYDGDDVDIFRVTSHKQLHVSIAKVTSLT